jgi:predicted nucleic acid-binding protein
MIVPDATIVSAFLFPKDDFHEVAVAIRDQDPDWHCPELVSSEVRSVGLKHHGKGDTLDSVIARCNLIAATVSVYRMHSFSVLQVAVEGNLWVYDAEYVALARQLNVPLVTTDGPLAQRFPSVAVSPKEYLKR